MRRLRQLAGLILRLSAPLCGIGTTAAADLPAPGALSGSSALGYSWQVKAQNATLCDAGSKQWTGTVKVTPERSLFFCESCVFFGLSDGRGGYGWTRLTRLRQGSLRAGGMPPAIRWFCGSAGESVAPFNVSLRRLERRR
jgi:hypothetical protein